MSVTTEVSVSDVRSRRPRPVAVTVSIAGAGRVGQAVVRVAARERDRLRAAGVDLTFTTALVRDPARDRDVSGARLVADPARLFDDPPDVLIEVMGGEEPARAIVAESLRRGIPVVTANKTVIARHGDALRVLACQTRTPLAFEAAVVAGVPFVGACARRPLVSRATSIHGILNATSNFVLTAIAAGASRAAALETAIALGYAEPDATADLGGRDAAEKLSILLRLAGCDVGPDALPTREVADLDRGDFALAAAVGGTLRPVALADLAAAHAWVGPAFVAASCPLARIGGITNSLTFGAADGTGVTFSGPGAGPEITAATILDDVVEIARGDHPMPFAGGEPSARCWAPTPPSGDWFIGIDRPGFTPEDVADHLAQRGVPPRRVESVAGSLAVLTWPLTASTVASAVDPLRALGLRVLAVPAIGVDGRG